MAFYSITFKGTRGLIKINQSAIKRLRNKRGFFMAAVIAYERWVKKNFQKEGRLHENSKFHWKPLEPGTIAARRTGAGTGTPKILRDTGALFGRWNRHATNSFGLLRSGVDYSETHEKGSSRKGIPQRKIFPTDKQGRKIIDDVLNNFVKRAIR